MTDETPYEAARRVFPSLPWECHEHWTECSIGPLQLEFTHVNLWRFEVSQREPYRIEWMSPWSDTPDEAARLTRAWLVERGEALLALAEMTAGRCATCHCQWEAGDSSCPLHGEECA